MASGFKDWLSPQTAGDLSSYILTPSAEWDDPNGHGLLAWLNPADSGVITRVQRIQAYSRVASNTVAPQAITLQLYRCAALGTGADRVAVPAVTTSPAAKLTAKEMLTVDPAFVTFVTQWVFQLVSRSAAGSDLIGAASQLATLYEHLADGRRQPLTLLQGGGMVLALFGGGGDGRTFAMVELTEEPL